MSLLHSAAVAAECKKQAKYIELSRSGDYAFVPVAIETLGSWGPSVLDVTAEIGGRIARCTGTFVPRHSCDRGWTLLFRRATLPQCTGQWQLDRGVCPHGSVGY